MKKRGGNSAVMLEDLKGINNKGYLLYTSAYETGGDAVNGIVTITEENMIGVDTALMEAGYEFIPDMGVPQELMFYMEREKEEGIREMLRYHPVQKSDGSFLPVVEKLGMRMRIDFFKLAETSVYDVVKKILELGFVAITPILRDYCIISGWVRFSPADGGYLAEEVEETAE